MKHCVMTLLLILGLTGGFPAGSGAAEEKILIGISIPTADHGWTGGIVWWARKAVDEFEKQYPGVELMLMAAGSTAKQIADLDAMVDERRVQGLVILPHEPAPLIPALEKAEKAGVFIVVVDRVLPEVPRDLYTAGDNYSFGFKSGEFLAKELGGRGDIVVMGGIPSDVDDLRQRGFQAALIRHPEVKILDVQPAMWNSQKGLELMESYLKKYKKIDAVWCQDDDVLKGVIQAYKRSDRRDVKLLLGGGGSKDIVKMILGGDPLVRGTVTYPPRMIYEGIGMAVRHMLNGQQFQAEEIIPSELVTRDNAKKYYYPDSIY